MDFKELQDFIKSIVRSGATEVNLETDEFKLSIKTPSKGRQNETQVVQQIPVPTGAVVNPQAQVMQTVPQTQVVQNPQVNTANAANEVEKAETDKTDKYITIKSPMVGTFYERPAPGKPIYVSVGDEIKTGSVVCIIEAMKLFNEIESEVNGKIVKILVEDATPVEFDQPLFLVDPA